MGGLQHWSDHEGGNLIGGQRRASTGRASRGDCGPRALHGRLCDSAVNVVGASEEKNPQQDAEQNRENQRRFGDLRTGGSK
jgi:hypothetical protein